MATDRNNANYKRIRLALELNERDVVSICRYGDLAVSRDRVSRWGRSPDAGAGRYSKMSDGEFDAFCDGLVPWLREADHE